jgi:hypothetical protein
VLDVEVPGTRPVFWAEPGIASALDSGAIPAGQDVGATGVFVPVVDGRQLTSSAPTTALWTARPPAAGTC